MIGPPGIERRVERRLVVEIAVAAVDRQPRRGIVTSIAPGPRSTTSWRRPARGRPSRARSGRRAQLGFDIGANAAARRANKRRRHRRSASPRRKRSERVKLQVKLCSWTGARWRMRAHARDGAGPNRLLLASIHDVSPRFESEVDRLLDLLARMSGPACDAGRPEPLGRFADRPGFAVRARLRALGRVRRSRCSSTAIPTATIAPRAPRPASRPAA